VAAGFPGWSAGLRRDGVPGVQAAGPAAFARSLAQVIDFTDSQLAAGGAPYRSTLLSGPVGG
jgi:hypothetical protein